MLYEFGSAREVPFAIDRAFAGEFDPFAELAVHGNRWLGDQLCFGMLMSIVCAEDVARIDPARIEEETRNTFLGDRRVRRQIDCCALWPRSDLPDEHAGPVSVPVLIFSGTLDPVTSARWGEEAVRHLPRGRHVVVPGSRFVDGECVIAIEKQFLERGSAEDSTRGASRRSSSQPSGFIDGGCHQYGVMVFAVSGCRNRLIRRAKAVNRPGSAVDTNASCRRCGEIGKVRAVRRPRELILGLERVLLDRGLLR